MLEFPNYVLSEVFFYQCNSECKPGDKAISSGSILFVRTCTVNLMTTFYRDETFVPCNLEILCHIPTVSCIEI